MSRILFDLNKKEKIKESKNRCKNCAYALPKSDMFRWCTHPEKAKELGKTPITIKAVVYKSFYCSEFSSEVIKSVCDTCRYDISAWHSKLDRSIKFNRSCANDDALDTKIDQDNLKECAFHVHYLEELCPEK